MHSSGVHLRAAFALGVLFLSASPLWGQAGTGSVQGTVRDASNASVPAAGVTLTNTATNVAFRTTTTGAGVYMFPGVVPGAYVVSVEAPGMKRFEGSLTLSAEQRAVIDVVLQLGDVTTSVSVEDVTPLVTTDVPTLGHVLERQRIEQLPIGDRNPSQFIVTVPGVESAFYGRAYGLRTGAIDTLVDGASTVERNYGDWNAAVRMDAVQEMVVETSNSSAKFARPVNMVLSTRSGTNLFKGSVYETHQNSAFGAARKREEYWSKAPQQIVNQFGVSAGGPVLLPKLYDGRNRTFWFFSYDGSRNVSPKTQGYSVPTEAMRKGDFSGLVDAQGRLLTLYDPWSTDSKTWARQPFSHGGRLNVIDPARLSPVAKSLFAITPLPTEPAVNPLIAPNLWTQVPVWNNADSITLRLDHQFSSNDRVFVRYSQGEQHWVASATGTSIGAFIIDPNVGRIINRSSTPNMAVSYTRVFTPTVFNELLVTGSLRPYRRDVGASEDYPGQLGLPNPFGAAQFPSFGNTGLTALDLSSGSLQYLNQGNFKLSDNATKIYGKHEFQFGGSLRYEQLNELPNTNGKGGGVTFNTLATALYDPKSTVTNPQAVPQSGHNLANLFLGVANYSATFLRHTNYLRDKEYALYLQDNFKVTPRLTLNLGLRWEYFTEYSERDNNWISFDRDNKQVILGAELEEFYRNGNSMPGIVKRFSDLGVRYATWQEAGLPQSLVQPNGLNFGPRLGFAWRFGSGKRAAVLRGGYRISYSSMPLAIWINPVQNNVPMRANYSNASLTNAAQSPDGYASYGMRSVPSIIAGLNSTNALNINDTSAITRGSAAMVYFNEKQPDVQVQDWNLTLEKEIMRNTMARVAYVGNHGGNLASYYYFNENPTDYLWFTTTGLAKPTGEYASVAMRPYDKQVYGGIREYGHMGYSNYQGIQLELERRFSQGIGFQVFYNLNNILATGDQEDVAAAATIPELNQFLPGAVPENLEERNRFLNYQRDPSIPKHKVGWNWIADLPFGKGKPLAGNASGWLNQLIGGWQVAGLGALNSNWFALPTGIYPNGEKIEQYGYQYPIQDCRGGSCQPGYLWWNGYIPPHQINSYDAKGNPTGVMGIPDNYKPAGQPLIPWPAKPVANDPLAPYYGTNTVWVRLKNGTEQRTTFNPGLHPWQKQYLPGIREWSLAASLYKQFPITESVFVRLNVTFFNVLNHPGNPNAIGGDGVLSTQTSGQNARRLQTTLRFTW